ncbi:MAG: hypothetical protein D6748_05230 [Calditrichaeota bacterium]|nr:MAG: hypothetical protein D6748_05230 [Calditrichota bacterium]
MKFLPFILQSIAGVILAIPFIFIISRSKKWRPLLALSLVITALIYVIFAVSFRGDEYRVLIEISGVFLYSIFALLGMKYTPLWISLGWATHVFWDIGLHLLGGGVHYAPDWYPPFCLGFDLLIAISILFLMKRDTQYALFLKNELQSK